MIHETGPKGRPQEGPEVTGLAATELGQGVAGLEPRPPASPRYLSNLQRRWLADLYRSDFPRVFRLCRRLLRNPDDAADAAHQTFLRAIDSFPPGSAHREVSPWLLTVARHLCIDELRRRKRLGSVMVNLAGEPNRDGDPEKPVLDRQVVAAILGQLRDRERQALWQSAVEQRSLGEIARDMRLSYMAAAQLLHRARRRAHILAMRLVALIGLLQIGRAAKRASLAGTRLLSALRPIQSGGSPLGAQHLLAVIVVPIALASVQPSSSAPATPLVQPAPVVTSVGTQLVPGGVVPNPTISTLPRTVPVPALPSALPQVPLPVPTPLPLPTPALSPALPSLPRSVENLTTGTLPNPVGPILSPHPF